MVLPLRSPLPVLLLSCKHSPLPNLSVYLSIYLSPINHLSSIIYLLLSISVLCEPLKGWGSLPYIHVAPRNRVQSQITWYIFHFIWVNLASQRV
jgi:hypothetical protein